MRRIWLMALAGTCLAASGPICVGPGGGDGTRVAALRGFSSSEELRRFLVDQANADRRLGGGGLSFFGPLLFPMLPAPTAGQADLAADGEAGGAENGDPFSTTNIQEAGVDESDVVKNDGQTIYVLDEDTIHIVRAVPPEGVVELATVEIESSGDSLYLRGNRLIALSQRYGYSWETTDTDGGTSLVGGEWNDGSETTVTVIDVTDPANPRVEATVRFEGTLATSRLIANRLHLVLTSVPRLPDVPIPLALSLMPLEQWLPDYELTGADGAVVRSGDIVGWQDFYRPEAPNGYGITTVVTLDVDNPTGAFESTAITADAGVIYASTAALYVTDTDYNWGTANYREDTAVHKVAFTDTGTAYVGSTFVPGRVLNQYSLGEYEGYLRMATSTGAIWFGSPTPATNGVYVLGESATEGELEIVGRVEDIAATETLYSARFVGTRGFLVTFKKIDPLFTLDLADPRNPRIVGELKVPGYSDYIHIMDENHLLTIGKDTYDMGDFAWYQGVQLCVFDVTDFEHPTRPHKKVIGVRGTESEALYNPKAFNYFAAKDALAVPIELYDGPTSGPSQYGRHTFSGLYVYRVTVDNGFEELGRISTENEQASSCYYGWYWSALTRGVFIGDYVYAATNLGVKAAALSDVSTVVGEAAFSSAEVTDENCYGWEEPLIAPAVNLGVQ